ncbi:MAG: sulfite exporter TauE/SafE family protein [Methylococcaceae bacterium]
MFIKQPFFISFLFTITVWVAWGLYTFPDGIGYIVDNWQVSLTMVIGSFVAGATSEGGGAIAFPVFTKLLNISAVDAKVFSLAIQSVGMLAASITIWVLRIKVSTKVIVWAGLGGIPGVISGAAILSPMLAPEVLRLVFTVIVVSLAMTLLVLNRGYRLYNDAIAVFGYKEYAVLLVAGFVGGVLTGLVGNGIDIFCFSVMVLLFRLSEKIATPTSVVLMAFNAMIGFSLHLFYLDGFNQQVQEYWLSAVPIVVVGAPLGAWVCSRMNNKTIANFLIALIVIELISTVWILHFSNALILIALTAFLFFFGLNYLMIKSKAYGAS